LGFEAACKVEEEDAGGLHSVLEVSIPPEAASPARSSNDAQLAFGLAGAAELRRNGRSAKIGPGEAVAIPPGLDIAWRNPGPTSATFLLFTIPLDGAPS
jgi:quercetin dioxygenase-like cupin family protein